MQLGHYIVDWSTEADQTFPDLILNLIINFFSSSGFLFLLLLLFCSLSSDLTIDASLKHTALPFNLQVRIM